MELQHVNVKLIVEEPAVVDLAPLVPIFHRWIQEKVCEELLLDIADYRHVTAGPGVVLIGLEADYSVDNTAGRLGVRYNRKAPLDGSNLDRFAQAARAALTACRMLEDEPSLAGKLRFGGSELELFVNDRLLAPNAGVTRSAADPELRTFARKLFGANDFAFSYDTDARNLFRAFVKAARPVSAADLLANLNS